MPPESVEKMEFKIALLEAKENSKSSNLNRKKKAKANKCKLESL